jgi:hypothetical protein
MEYFVQNKRLNLSLFKTKYSISRTKLLVYSIILELISISIFLVLLDQLKIIKNALSKQPELIKNIYKYGLYSIAFLCFISVIESFFLTDEISFRNKFYNKKLNATFIVFWSLILIFAFFILCSFIFEITKYYLPENKIIKLIDNFDEKYTKYIFIALALILLVVSVIFSIQSYYTKFYIEYLSQDLSKIYNECKTEQANNVKTLLEQCLKLLKFQNADDLEDLKGLLDLNRASFNAQDKINIIKTTLEVNDLDKDIKLAKKLIDILDKVYEIYHFEKNYQADKNNKSDKDNKDYIKLTSLEALLQIEVSQNTQ